LKLWLFVLDTLQSFCLIRQIKFTAAFLPRKLKVQFVAILLFIFCLQHFIDMTFFKLSQTLFWFEVSCLFFAANFEQKRHSLIADFCLHLCRFCHLMQKHCKHIRWFRYMLHTSVSLVKVL